MSFLNNEEYDNDKEFTQAELGELTAENIMRWFHRKTYGQPDPPTGHNLPPIARSNSLNYWKKALSFYMPNRLMVWDEINKRGNPTRCTAINDLIKTVKRKEARHQGALSQTRRAITEREYCRVMALLKQREGMIAKYGIPALMNFQFHLIARIDDSTQATLEHVKPHDHFDFLLKTRLNWSKNVNDERDAPWQTIIPCMNHVYCVHLSLALWLEIFIGTNPAGLLTPYIFAFSDDILVPKGGHKSKGLVQSIFRSSIFNRPEFAPEKGLLGSHSIRKYASTETRKRGATKDEKDLRGRWKRRSRVSDVYDDVELPFPDAKVAALLCIGGPCKYQLKEGSGITDAFILDIVAPNIRQRLGDQVAMILGKALLWYIFDPTGDTDIPQEIYQRVTNAYTQIRGTLPADTNPVTKVPMVLSGNEGEVYFDELPTENAIATAAGGTAATSGSIVGGSFIDRPIREQLLAIHSQLMGLRQGHNELRELIQQDRIDRTRQYQVLNSNLRRIALQPARRVGSINNNSGSNQQDGGDNANHSAAPRHEDGHPDYSAATLSPNPRTLYILWQEYHNGIGGRKAAHLFTPQERGRNKFKYSRRKVVWDCISTLVRSGLQANVAIDRIYGVYGHGATVTTIINRMKRDRKTNSLHASLRV